MDASIMVSNLLMSATCYQLLVNFFLDILKENQVIKIKLLVREILYIEELFRILFYIFKFLI